MACLYIVGIITALIAVAITFFKWYQRYWERRNFPSYPSDSLIFGSASSVFAKIHFGMKLKYMYDEMKKKGLKHFGMYVFSRPIYVPIDLDYVKNILSTDFSHFVDRGHYYNEKYDPISAHLFNLEGTKWRNLRAKLTPTFTSGKMKMMFGTLVDCGDSLDKAMKKIVGENQAVDIKDVLSCFTTDIIGSCAFGLNCNSFEEPDSLFRTYGKEVFKSAISFRRLKFFFIDNCPNVARKLGIVTTKKEISDFFTNVIREAIEYREKNDVIRKDFLQLLIDLNKQEKDQKNDETSLTFNEMVAQCFVFFLAGFETSSTTMSFALYELALNLDLQEKTRQEVLKVMEKHDDKITYDAINEMKYMNQILDETLRKYPPSSVLTRICIKDYKVPDSDLILKKGTQVFIPVMGIQRDSEFYPNPDQFDPERFSEENKSNRHGSAYIPFGDGPRLCIGMRFGLMQSKVGLAILLKKYKFTVSDKTKQPLEMTPKSFILAVEGDIWLNVHEIK